MGKISNKMTTPIRESELTELRRLLRYPGVWSKDQESYIYNALPRLLDQIAADRALIADLKRDEAEYAATIIELNTASEGVLQVNEDLRALLDAAAVGLEPFAWAATEIDEMGGDIWPDGDFFRVALGHLRAARALLGKLRPTPSDAPTLPLRPGLPDSEDTHQDRSFGAGGQEQR